MMARGYKYVAREAAVIEGIERGLADVKAGRLVPHDDAMARLDETVAGVERGDMPGPQGQWPE